MEGILATDGTTAPAAPVPARPALETWGGNERMRHVPPMNWIVDKLDGDVRHRVEILLQAIAAGPAVEEHRADEALLAFCRSLDQLADIARHSRGNHEPGDLPSRVPWALNNAVSSVRSLDPDLFGRRYPMQTFERSKAEPVYSALTAVIYHLAAVIAAVQQIDPDIEDKLYASLVQLEQPLRTDPIAQP